MARKPGVLGRRLARGRAPRRICIAAKFEGKPGRVGTAMDKPPLLRCFLTVVRYRIQTKPTEESFLFISERIILRHAPGFDFIQRSRVKKIPGTGHNHVFHFHANSMLSVSHRRGAPS